MRRTNRRRELQILADGQVLIEGIFLWDVANVFFQLVEVWIKGAAIQKNLAAGRLKLAGEHTKKSALAATARAHHANQFAASE